MKSITIRKIPDDLYRAISRLAQRNRRSIQQQVVTILDRSRILDNESPLERAAIIRAKLAGRSLGDTIEEIRQERSR